MSARKLSSNPTYDFPTQQPFYLQDRFRNLQNPLKFIQSQRMRTLETNSTTQKQDLKRLLQDKSQFSKSIYKKVISRDNDYNFQHEVVTYEYDRIVHFNHKYSKAGQHQKIQQRPKIQNLQRKFKHGEIISMEQKRQRLRQSKEIPLNFKHVKLIDTPEFDSLKDVQFYDLIKGQSEDKDFMRSSNEIDNSAFLVYMENFKHKLIEQSQYHSKNSYNFLFNCDRQLDFWKINNLFKDEKKTDDDILANCAFMDTYNVSIFDMFDFSSRNIEIGDIIKFYQLKKKLNAQMETEKNNESLQQKYNQAKRRFEQMKQNRLKSKNQRIPAKFIDNTAQTNDQMKQKDFDDYFAQDAKQIFQRLKLLNQIRDRVLQYQQGVDFKVMLTNIGLEISNELFKLLLVVLKGQDVSNYNQFVRADNEGDVQRKILQLIYLQFKNFKIHEVNGYSKTDIIKLYLQQREKNERVHQTYLFKNTNASTQKKSITPKSKTTKKK